MTTDSSVCWELRSVESVCTRVTTGGTPSRRRPDFFENGTIAWFRTGELKDQLLFDSEEHITEDALESSSAKVFPANTVLMAMYGDGDTITTLGVLRRPAATNQACCAMMPDPDICNWRYLFYALKHTRKELLRVVVGGAQRNLSGTLIRQHKIPLPPLSEQKAIARVLGALDDKIELNRRMNATLESMARALFQSWFVDFDPVRAKLDGRKPVALDPATAALFPDSFQDSPLGLIPQGWEVKTIADVTLRVTKGDTPRSEAIQACPSDDRLIPMLRVNTITEFGEVLLDKAEMIPESIHLGKSKRSILEENDILYTNAGTIGRVTLVQKHFLPANTNQAMAIIRPDPSRVPPAFLYMIMRQSEFQTNLHHDIVHAVQANLALGKISAARAVFPPMATLTRLTDPIVALLNKIFDNRNQSRILATLRDTLLPKLLSGELKVAEREN